MQPETLKEHELRIATQFVGSPPESYENAVDSLDALVAEVERLTAELEGLKGDWRESDVVKAARRALSEYEGHPTWAALPESQWADLLRGVLEERDFIGEWLQRCLDDALSNDDIEAIRHLANEAAIAVCEPRRFHENEDGGQQKLGQAVARARTALREIVADDERRLPDRGWRSDGLPALRGWKQADGRRHVSESVRWSDLAAGDEIELSVFSGRDGWVRETRFVVRVKASTITLSGDPDRPGVEYDVDASEDDADAGRRRLRRISRGGEDL